MFLTLLLSLLALSPLVAADELSVASHPSDLHLPLGQPLDSSPGARPASITTCNRVHIRGLARLRHLAKYSHALKIKISVAQGDAIFSIRTVELCFHRNSSLGVGMCPAGEWEPLSEESWSRSVSPYGDWILDVRMLPDPSRSIELSTEYEFLIHQLVLLMLGVAMMSMAGAASESVVFYYGSAMAGGVILVVLMILFQGMKLLPTGRKSSLAIFIYSSTYLSGLLRSVLLEIGISEDMHNLLCVFLLVCLVLAGAWFGCWGICQVVLTEEGLVDSSVAYFVEWAILIFSAVMILQSSLDTLLAIVALGLAITIAAISGTKGKPRALRFVFKRVFVCIPGIQQQCQASELVCRVAQWLRAKHFNPPPSSSPSGSNGTPGVTSFEQQKYYSSFHNTPERKRFSKEEWEVITRDETGKALRELISSPDFTRWAVANAERITLTPPEVGN